MNSTLYLVQKSPPYKNIELKINGNFCNPIAFDFIDSFNGIN